MSEHTMYQRVMRGLRPFDPLRVENPMNPGTPDINFIEGWLECKWMRRWPKNADVAIVRLEHFTNQQRIFLSRRWERGGNAWLLWQIGNEWLLFDGKTAAEVVGRVARKHLYLDATKTWGNIKGQKGLIDQEFRECLMPSQKPASLHSLQESASS